MQLLNIYNLTGRFRQAIIVQIKFYLKFLIRNKRHLNCALYGNPKKMKITGIKKKHHVYADYSYVPMVLAAPAIAGFEDNKPAALICRSFALSALAYSLCTKAKWGVLKIIPYKIHAGLDVAAGVLALAATATPQIRDVKRARTTFVLMGVTGIVVGALSLLGAMKER